MYKDGVDVPLKALMRATLLWIHGIVVVVLQFTLNSVSKMENFNKVPKLTKKI